MRLAWLALLGVAGLINAESNDTEQRRSSPTFTPQHFRNVNLVRNINLDKSYARETINVVIENIDTNPQSEYFIAFEPGTGSRLGGVEVKDKKVAENTGFIVAAIPEYASLFLYGATSHARIDKQTVRPTCIESHCLQLYRLKNSRHSP